MLLFSLFPFSTAQALVEALPVPFVGTELRLRAAVATLCRLASHSLQAQQLAVPPWRRTRFLQACYSRGLALRGGSPSEACVAFSEKVGALSCPLFSPRASCELLVLLRRLPGLGPRHLYLVFGLVLSVLNS